MRAKVIKKPEGLKDYYDQVGDVVWRGSRGGQKMAVVAFGDGHTKVTKVFFEDELRMGVKASD